MSPALSLHELESIERFVSFLECRVRTDSLELLCRFAREIHHSAVVPAQSPALHAFITTGATQIAVLPLPIDDDDANANANTSNARATQLLQEQQQRQQQQRESSVVVVRPTFFVWIEHCVLTKNWPWLVTMFVEFLHGHDDCLQAFLRAGVQAISAMPCARWEIVHLAPVPAPEPPSSAPSPTPTPARAAPNSSTVPFSSSSSTTTTTTPPSPTAAPVVVKRKRGRPPRVRPPESAAPPDPQPTPRVHLDRLSATAQSVLQEVATLTTSKPWRQLYDVERISYPFDAAALPEVAARFRTFWATHARAVYERHVWVPLDSADAKRTRKCRQDFASRSFETNVIMPLYHALGAQFFVELDARAPPHDWWWYRRPVVEVLVLLEKAGDDATLAYVRRTATDRFAGLRKDLPRGRMHNHQCVSASMWSTHAKCAPLLREIRELKMMASTLPRSAEDDDA